MKKWLILRSLSVHISRLNFHFCGKNSKKIVSSDSAIHRMRMFKYFTPTDIHEWRSSQPKKLSVVRHSPPLWQLQCLYGCIQHVQISRHVFLHQQFRNLVERGHVMEIGQQLDTQDDYYFYARTRLRLQFALLTLMYWSRTCVIFLGSGQYVYIYFIAS